MNILKFERKKKFDDEYFKLHLGINFWQIDLNRWDKAEFVKDADKESYQVLNHHWAKDKNYLYRQGFKLGLPDYETFRVLNDCYALDKNTVYTTGGVFNGIKDLHSFEVCDDGYHPETIPVNAPSDSFPLSDENWLVNDINYEPVVHGGYAKDQYNAYFYSELLTTFSEFYDDKDADFLGIEKFTIINDIDFGSFKTLTSGFAADKFKVYFFGHVLENCDPASFDIDTFPTVNYRDQLVLPISRDNNNVYLGYKQFISADANTFVTIDPASCWFQDKQNVYYNQYKLPLADSQSFNLLDMNYAVDKSHAYFEQHLITDADVNSIEQISSHFFAQDNHYVYSGQHPALELTHGKLRGIPSFEGTDEYFKDTQDVYYLEMDELKRINVDYDSFELLSPEYGDPEARDKNHLYLHGEIYIDSIDQDQDQDQDQNDLAEHSHPNALLNADQTHIDQFVQEEVSLLKLLDYDENIKAIYIDYLLLDSTVEQRIQQYSIDDYEKLGDILSGDDELEKHRVKKEIQEYKFYTQQVDSFIESDIDALSVDNELFEEMAFQQFEEFSDPDTQAAEEASLLQSTWWGNNPHSVKLKEHLFASIEILASGDDKIIDDARTLIFNTHDFYQKYKNDVDYIDILTYAKICEKIDTAWVLDPVRIIFEYMLLPNHHIYSIEHILIDSALKETFTQILEQHQLTFDLSILDDEILREQDFDDLSAYLYDQLAEKFNDSEYKLFVLNGEFLNSTNFIAVLPFEQYHALLQFSSSQLHFKDYFTSQPLRRGEAALLESIADENKHNLELLAKLDAFDRSNH